MKIIFSRKGFDSVAGEIPSPIFPSGKLCSLPIPETASNGRTCRYGDVQVGQESLAKVVQDLKGRFRGELLTSNSLVHLDPDLNPESISRLPDWKPVFGQAGAAEKHLRNRNVDAGDIFLFYGWFREVEQVSGKYRYVQRSPDLHVMFGWLQIEQRFSMSGASDLPEWMLYHPHCQQPKYDGLNGVYVSRDRLTEIPLDQPGAGLFQRFLPELSLTAPGKTRSIWQLPLWFHPTGRQSSLSYHNQPGRWSFQDNYAFLQTVGRGQEFVLDCNDYPEAKEWLTNLLKLSN